MVVKAAKRQAGASRQEESRLEDPSATADLLRCLVGLCASMPRTVWDLQELLARGRSETYRQIARGIEADLLERHAPLRGQPALIAASAEGQRWVGSGLRAARISPASVPHWVACSSVALDLRRERSQARILSAAQLRLEEEIEGRLIASAVIGSLPDGRDRLHRPDLILCERDRVIAIEVELSPKAPQRLAQIVRAWRRASQVDEVLYLCAAGVTYRAVEAAVKRAHATGRVRVEQWRDAR